MKTPHKPAVLTRNCPIFKCFHVTPFKKIIINPKNLLPYEYTIIQQERIDLAEDSGLATFSKKDATITCLMLYSHGRLIYFLEGVSKDVLYYGQMEARTTVKEADTPCAPYHLF